MNLVGLFEEMSITCSSVELKDNLMRCKGRFRLKCFPRGENFPSASLVWNLVQSRTRSQELRKGKVGRGGQGHQSFLRSLFCARS